MKKKINFESILSLMLVAVATILGGGALAIETPTVNNYGSNENDPQAGTALEGATKTTPTDKGGISQHGKDANASVLQQAGFLDNKMFRKIIEHHALRYPFYTDMFTKATQFAFVGHKEAEYPEIGDIKTESHLQTAVNNASNKYETVTLYVPKADKGMFSKDYTISVPGYPGFDEGVVGQFDDSTGAPTNGNGEQLLLLVVGTDDNGYPRVKALNGPATSSNDATTWVPNIPAGSLLMLGAPALAEEEVEVAPLNIIPTTNKAYLQKKGYSVAFTDFFEEAVKEVDWEKDRVKRQTLDAYKKIYTTTALFGAKRKFWKQTPNGNRLCYTQEGLINQLRMMYELNNGVWTKADLIAIAKMLFTAYTDATKITVYMGSDAIESLLNIDWGTDTKKITYLKDDTFKINIASFETPFGVLEFKHEKSLTYHHLEDAAIAIPMEDCMRIYRDNGSTFKVDGKKGETGRVEELTKEFFVQDDCFLCNSMASMLIGPSSLFNSGYGAGIVETYKSVTTLPTASATYYAAGDKYYLTVNTNTYERGLYECYLVSAAVGETPAVYGWRTYNRALAV